MRTAQSLALVVVAVCNVQSTLSFVPAVSYLPAGQQFTRSHVLRRSSGFRMQQDRWQNVAGIETASLRGPALLVVVQVEPEARNSS